MHERSPHNLWMQVACRNIFPRMDSLTHILFFFPFWLCTISFICKNDLSTGSCLTCSSSPEYNVHRVRKPYTQEMGKWCQVLKLSCFKPGSEFYTWFPASPIIWKVPLKNSRCLSVQKGHFCNFHKEKKSLLLLIIASPPLLPCFWFIFSASLYIRWEMCWIRQKETLCSWILTGPDF